MRYLNWILWLIAGVALGVTAYETYVMLTDPWWGTVLNPPPIPLPPGTV